jgi:tripartite-type tricarboxylate transporter receptor subunit TctC
MKFLKLVAAIAVCSLIPTVHAANFPQPGQTLKLVVPFAAGGGVDSAARRVAEQVRKQLGVTVIVENKAGASGTVGGRAVQLATPDGITLLFSAATHVLAKQIMSSAPYDPQADFVPIARVGGAP